jgi:hypothetical protein
MAAGRSAVPSAQRSSPHPPPQEDGLRNENRSPYDPHKPIPPDFVDALSHLPGDDADVKLFLFTAEADRKKIAELSSAANTEIYSDPDVQHGSERWIRTKWSSVQKFRDGLTATVG